MKIGGNYDGKKIFTQQIERQKDLFTQISKEQVVSDEKNSRK